MNPRHEGWIAKARIVLQAGRDAGFRSLAEGLIFQQAREVGELAISLAAVR